MRLSLSLAFALILGPFGMAEAQTLLSERVTLAHGSFTSGGGLTIAAELRPTTTGGTALCGVWAESASQSSYTVGEARRIVKLASVSVDGRRVTQDLGFLPEVAPQLDYAGQPARCRALDLPWREGRVPEIFVPRQQISSAKGGGSDPTISFRQTGTGAMEPALDVVPLLVRNIGLVSLSRAARVSEGRYSSGGGLRVAAEVVQINGRAHLCGVWSDLPPQVEMTEPLGREILRRSRAERDGQVLFTDLSGLRRVRARTDYTGAQANCLDSGRLWTPADARATLTLRLPTETVYRNTAPTGRQVIRFFGS
ncbi:MAG: orotidine 5-phosphate decarboxylase [Rhodobacteraceae bacterium CG17_big_fil_post_rev_8_21_14_2_50_63_15]|nr:MAG: orotidine 5-phosphate decarboxylase [Rhodobacteraceae bacterium CG17_big_fil_post_rev_8_21_14_2_50_63_15]